MKTLKSFVDNDAQGTCLKMIYDSGYRLKLPNMKVQYIHAFLSVKNTGSCAILVTSIVKDCTCIAHSCCRIDSFTPLFWPLILAVQCFACFCTIVALVYIGCCKEQCFICFPPLLHSLFEGAMLMPPVRFSGFCPAGRASTCPRTHPSIPSVLDIVTFKSFNPFF